MGGSIDRGKATRGRILVATAELIAQAGWSGFSTRDIAARAGVNQGVVSYHWRSKDELVREAALAATAESLEPVAAALREGPTLQAALERFLGLIDAVRAHPALTALLFETMLHAGRDEPLRAALKGMLRDFREPLAVALARDGVAEPEARATALAAALDGLLLHAVVDDELDVDTAGAALRALLTPP
jgi:TetR/AcrR family transcriptional regulator, regulator of biofilm formation and stress response